MYTFADASTDSGRRVKEMWLLPFEITVNEYNIIIESFTRHHFDSSYFEPDGSFHLAITIRKALYTISQGPTLKLRRSNENFH